MADDRITVSGVNWREAFAFTHLFRTFRVAVHPSKLVLGLMLLLSLYVGGLVLDKIWPSASRAVPQEVELYAQWSRDRQGDFESRRQAARRTVESRYAQLLLDYKVFDTRENADRAAREIKQLEALNDAIQKKLQEDVDAIDKALKDATEAAKSIENADERQTAIERAEKQHDRDLAGAYARRYADHNTANQIRNQGLFWHFFLYQVDQVEGVVEGVLQWDWLSEAGVIKRIWNFLAVGPGWLVTQHPVFFIVFVLLFLVVWGIFGGAIARIAAVHVARQEKLSIRQALRFSVSKLLSFVFAPIIPLLIVLGLGLVVTVCSMLSVIPFVGEVVIGLLFFLALAVGLIMTLVTLGLIGGFNLMYPTIAVEGSDSFDAISRSFSYVYARPWKMAFYTLVAVVYGALTYLFVRFFIWLSLTLTHTFVGWGFFRHANNGESLFLTMWPKPQFDKLTYDINFMALGVGGDIGASLMSFWVYLFIGLLGAFAISFYFSANMIIYYLMRKDVDATEMDDVYVEQMDEEFAETPASGGDNAAASTASAPAAESDSAATPPSTPPSDAGTSSPASQPAGESPSASSEPTPPSDEGESKPDDENRPA